MSTFLDHPVYTCCYVVMPAATAKFQAVLYYLTTKHNEAKNKFLAK